MNPTVTTLTTGYVLVRFDAECFAQLPPGFVGETIPDEYIFNPEQNRQRVNDWWQGRAMEVA